MKRLRIISLSYIMFFLLMSCSSSNIPVKCNVNHVVLETTTTKWDSKLMYRITHHYKQVDKITDQNGHVVLKCSSTGSNHGDMYFMGRMGRLKISGDTIIEYRRKWYYKQCKEIKYDLCGHKFSQKTITLQDVWSALGKNI